MIRDPLRSLCLSQRFQHAQEDRAFFSHALWQKRAKRKLHFRFVPYRRHQCRGYGTHMVGWGYHSTGRDGTSAQHPHPCPFPRGEMLLRWVQEVSRPSEQFPCHLAGKRRQIRLAGCARPASPGGRVIAVPLEATVNQSVDADHIHPAGRRSHLRGLYL